jgi:UDP-glucuronate 4-epimerase
MAIHKFARFIDRGEPITIHGDGLSRRDYTYISDVVDGLLRMATAPQGQFEVVNLGSGRQIPLKRVVEALEAALEKKAELRFAPEAPGDVPVTCADIRKARAVLGYYPCVTFAGGTRRFVQWLRGRDGHEGRQ